MWCKVYSVIWSRVEYLDGGCKKYEKGLIGFVFSAEWMNCLNYWQNVSSLPFRKWKHKKQNSDAVQNLCRS